MDSYHRRYTPGMVIDIWIHYVDIISCRYSTDFFDGKHQVVVGYSSVFEARTRLFHTYITAWRILCHYPANLGKEDLQKLVPAELPLSLGWRPRCIRYPRLEGKVRGQKCKHQ